MKQDICLEHKFCRIDGGLALSGESRVQGYASIFGIPDQQGDVVVKGAYARSLASGRKVRMLWQHNPAEPIGVWDRVEEDARGLCVSGHILTGVTRGREALALLSARAIDGLSIGFRLLQARHDSSGRRQLLEIELWEASLVTFPMMPSARLMPEKFTREGTTLIAALDHLTTHVARARRSSHTGSIKKERG